MSKCLTLYDVTGIQSFIFASNKAKENIGGSIYVQKIFEEGLVRCVEELGKIKTNWQDSTHLEMKTDTNLKAEVIYIGGGNAMVLFNSKETAVEVTKQLSKKILEETQATLGVAVAYQETNLDNFQEDRMMLFKTLSENKARLIQSTPLRAISITRECADGLSSEGEKEKGNFISKATVNKIELAKDENKSKNKFSKLLPKDYRFPLDFDELGQKDGESHIAVIHIDGNSMGRFIDERLSGKDSYDVAIPVIREISSELQQLYVGVFKETVESCKEAIQDERVSKRLKLENGNLPIRPIILNGDDVTFVCDGRIGIQLANYFLEMLAKTPLVLEGVKYDMSACAGVAIVKSHFPFFRAYELAEELCGSAKKKAKALNKEDPGCWIDYHIVYSGFQTDLDVMRKEQYNVPGMAPVMRDVRNKFSQYNLLLRPFCVTGRFEHVDMWSAIEKLYKEIKEKFPRSRLKNLRNGFISSENDVEMLQKQNASRNYTLPDFEMGSDLKCNDTHIFRNNQTPYFEPLELLDFYLTDLKLEEEDKKS